MPRSLASDLGLLCLPMSHKKDARLIRVKNAGSDPTCREVIGLFLYNKSMT